MAQHWGGKGQEFVDLAGPVPWADQNIDNGRFGVVGGAACKGLARVRIELATLLSHV